MAEIAEVDLTPPRNSKFQIYRPNVPHDSAEEYYRRAMYIPFLDQVLSDMDTRFSAARLVYICSTNIKLTACSEHVLKLSMLLPAHCNNFLFAQWQGLSKHYGAFLTTNERIVLEDEFRKWQRLWKNCSHFPAGLYTPKSPAAK